MTKKRSTDIRTCPVCGHTVQRSDMQFTRDCNGIPFRLVCWDCYDQLMAKGYDGEYYTEADENIDYVAGIESRGFIFGAPLACKLNAGFVTVRKPNKLPADTIKETYD